ncbi:MAG: class I SAM-dependent rRNA methyltransferase [Acholeplasmatales bacterium]|nr:class I SAM-dependent rRNA methyltransferase [Acholeplasmatales bacterium]
MLNIILNKNEEKEKLEGFPWIFNNEIYSFDGIIKNGEVVKVLTFDKKFLCYGFLNTSSKIMVRILSMDENEIIDKEFFKKRILDAIEHRNNLNFKDSNCYRLVFSEADFLPGLVVDKYADYLCIQISSLGMELIKKDIIDILVELLNPKGIYERSDVSSRAKEGLEEFKGIVYGEFNPRVQVLENGIKFYVDMENGQKTGYFLDQKLNRDNIKYYCNGKDVLDCFSNVGGFALNAAKNGAKSVLACDISALACSEIEQNAKLNNFNNLKTKCCDVFDLLRSEEIKNKFDCIVLDPPAFTKSKDTIKKAYKGYKEINLQAIKAIKKGGYLLTFSCSQHMTPDLFLQMVKDALVDSKRKAQFIEFKVQSPDHPSLFSSEEQLYLKCVVLRVF